MENSSPSPRHPKRKAQSSDSHANSATSDEIDLKQPKIARMLSPSPDVRSSNACETIAMFENNDDDDGILGDLVLDDFDARTVDTDKTTSSPENGATSSAGGGGDSGTLDDDNFDGLFGEMAMPVKVGEGNEGTDDDMFGDMELPAEMSEQDAVRMMQLDLTGWTRCRVVALHPIERGGRLLIVQIADTTSDTSDGRMGRCYLLSVWASTPLVADDIVSIQAVWQPERRAYCVDMQHGYLILSPDQLISGTTVTSAVFCQRKAILAERYPGVDGTNRVMFIGTLVHELFQAAIARGIATDGDARRHRESIQSLANTMLSRIDMLVSLYETEMSVAELRHELNKFVPRIVDFMRRYMAPAGDGNASSLNRGGTQEFGGRIERVLDIEENLWIPEMGLKGKVDVTAMVRRRQPNGQQIGDAELMPVELKTGKPTFSTEHRGQVSLYQMMMVATGRTVKSGLLLYLADGIMREISVARNDQRDLIMLRNQIAYHCNHNIGTITELTTDTAAPLRLLFGKKVRSTFAAASLPEPISHHSACGTCPYNTICCAFLARDPVQLGELSERHPLRPLIATVSGHLSAAHMDYFVHWSGLLALEDSHGKNSENSISTMWTETPEARQKRRKALTDLCVVGRPIEEFNTFHHIFKSGQMVQPSDKRFLAFTVDEYVRVSTRKRSAIAAGYVRSVTRDTIAITLERNLMKTYPRERFIVDSVESNTLMRKNTANLGRLLDDSAQTNRIRALIIDRVAPTFMEKPPFVLDEIADALISILNKEQRRAVRLAMTANDYMLLRGLPGTGKTQTIAALVVLLRMQGKRVLITSHTHSAVDTVLRRVIAMSDDPCILRIGDETRIAPRVAKYSHSAQMADCKTPDELREKYASFTVVGVTCLGASHPMLAQNQFDVCIMDEATQVLQPTALRPLFNARTFVLIGDPDQLPPIVRSRQARTLGCDESLFVRLDGRCPEAIVTLTQQYRMNATITALANSLTYGGTLKCANEQVAEGRLKMVKMRPQGTEREPRPWKFEWVQRTLSDQLRHSVVLLHTGNVFERSVRFETMVGAMTSSANGSRAAKVGDNADAGEPMATRLYVNYCEAAVIVQLVEGLHDANIPPENIGIIAPYSAQVELLRCAVNRRLDVSTVDQFQGRDKEVIIMSCTKCDNPALKRTPAEYAKAMSREGEILADLRRLTVAVTRAKHKLILVGDVDSLQAYEPFTRLFRAIGVLNRFGLADGEMHFQWPYVMDKFEKFGRTASN